MRYGSIILIFIILLSTGATFFLQWYALEACGNERGKNIEASYNFMCQRYPFLEPWLDSLRQHNALRDTFIRAEDGTPLHALYLYADSLTPQTAVVVHGYTDNAVRMMHIAYLYHHDLHYNVLLPDLRFSGKSGGNHLQMGWKDRLDLLQWAHVAHRLFSTPSSEACIALHGISMGGAAIMSVSGERQPPYIRCYIDDCGYTSVWDEYEGELQKRFGLPPFPLLYLADLATHLRYGWSFREASPLEQVRKCKRPMLFIHGDSDTFVPTWMGDSLHAAHQGIKAYWKVPGAKHADSYLKYSKEYTEKVKTFLKMHNNPEIMNNFPAK